MKKIVIFIMTAFLFASTGCHSYYVPATQNVPLFKEKNEYRAGVYLGESSRNRTINAQAAYSITDRFAVMTNFMLSRYTDGPRYTDGLSSDEYGSGKGKYFEAAFGYFEPFKKHGVFEIYGGLGTSNQNYQYYEKTLSFFTYSGGTADLSFTKIFLQPSVGFTSSYFDFAFTSGLSRISFNKINNQLEGPLEFFLLDDIAQNRTSLLFEPSVTVRGGSEYVKLQLQVTNSINLSQRNPNYYVEPWNVSLGLTFAFAERFRKK